MAVQAVVESYRGDLPEVEGVVGAQDAFLIEPHDKALGERDSPRPARVAVRSSNNQIAPSSPKAPVVRSASEHRRPHLGS